ncbi:MAG: UDP-3-O-(3-hydroxymyristoyl)glucosamine N-acyltransferase [Deltaproteobacteria bacterium]|nr:UDP-3-O-(3-hydroxymyristoyl)glucosamine N-acyltransferase [Deltaproteobacteria bacterium]
MSGKGHHKTWRLSELASQAGGHLEGDGTLEISGLNSLKDAGTGELAFLANPKYLPELERTKASAVILPPDVPVRIAAIRSPNPYLAFAKIATLMQGERPAPLGVSSDLMQGVRCRLGKDLSIHPRVVLGNHVTVGDRVTLHSGVVIGDNSIIGDDTRFYSNVSVRENCRIGKRVILHCGVVIGSDGFGFAPDGNEYYKIPQTGGVVLEDDVEIGANSTIDRGALGDTIIRRGTKIDNLVMIAHNVEIGENSIIVSQVGISGSTKIGNHVTLAGQVGVAGHLTIGDEVTVGAQSGITRNLAPKKRVSGLPVIDHQKWLKAASSFEHLPTIRKAVRKLEERIRELEATRREAPGSSKEGGYRR